MIANFGNLGHVLEHMNDRSNHKKVRALLLREEIFSSCTSGCVILDLRKGIPYRIFLTIFWSYNCQTLAVFQLCAYLFHMWSLRPFADYTWVRQDYTSTDMTTPGQTWLYLIRTEYTWVRNDYTWSDMTIPGQKWLYCFRSDHVQKISAI